MCVNMPLLRRLYWALCSGVNLGGIQETIYSARYQTWVSSKQGKCLTPFTFSLAPYCRNLSSITNKITVLFLKQNDLNFSF